MNPKRQQSPYQSPWSWWSQGLLFCWRLSWLAFCQWTPKFLNPWRILVLKIFGANLSGMPFIHSKARIQIPWNLTMQHRACLGELTNAYSLGKIEILEGATVAQEAYLCTGTHDFENPTMQLITEKIIIGKNSFIGARAMCFQEWKLEKMLSLGLSLLLLKMCRLMLFLLVILHEK